MFRSRGKSRSRAPATLSPTSSGESFIQKKFSTLHRGDVKTLAVSSIAVASSIASPSLNQTHPPLSSEQNVTHTSHADHNAAGRECSSHRAADSAWQTAYSTARMVVDITKESSDMFLPLKAVVGALSVLIKNYDQTVGNARQIEEIEKRVILLSDVLRSPLGEDDHSERARKELLCRRLVDVLEKMEPLSEQNGMLKFLRNGDYTGLLNGFVQDISNAVTDYQTSLQQSTYKNTKDTHEVSRNIDQTTRGIAESTVDTAHKIDEAADLETLSELNPVRDAGYQAEHHERCLSGTRESILEDIMRWAQNPQDQPVYWLNGLAGTGKSTIAQTFSEMANNGSILGASFFCSRDYLDRRVLKNIFPTIAYQLACRYPRFRGHLINIIKRDPSVAHNSLISQLKDLLVDPLSLTGISCVVVIDALDECVDDQPASAILSVLGRLVSKLPLVKFFITGRPEPRIRSGFRLPLLEPFTQVFLLHEVDPTSVGSDIRLYLIAKLIAIAKRRSGLDLPEVWPSDEDITMLVKKSSGLFIFASTVARFIESEHHEPRERLRLIISKADNTSHEGASGIDSLYSQVLRDAFFGIKDEPVFVDLKRILSAVVLALNPLSRDGLVQLLDIDSAVISTRLRHLHSVLLVPADGAKEIRVFHKSFPDFLQDPDRCQDSRFHIDYSKRHGDMTLNCLNLVGKLKMNPCALPPFVMNRDVPDRPRLLMDKLGSGLRYACKYWSTHLSFSPSSGAHQSRLITSTSPFFDHTLFPWVEIMSLEDNLEGVIHSMNHLLVWLGEVSGIRSASPRDRSLTIREWKASITDGPLLDLATDCLRFTLHFFRPIQASARHIYHTALPLSPEISILRRRFFDNLSLWEEDLTTQQASSSSTLATWGPVLRTIKADSGSFTHVAVAGQRIVTVCEDRTVNVYDAVTGVLRLSLNPPEQVTKVGGSPDGSVVFCAHQQTREITTWDTQTGGLIHTFTTNFKIRDIAVSLDGKYLASCSSDGIFVFWEVENGCEGSRIWEQPVQSICWLEPEDQIALVVGEVVVILEMTTGRTLHTLCTGGDVREIAFSADQRRLAVLSTFGTEETIEVFDIQTELTLVLSPALNDVSCFSFSGDGDQIFCATKTGDLRSLHISGPSPNWLDHQTHPGTMHSMNLLRSGHLVVNLGGSIQLLELEYVQPSATSRSPEIAHIYQLDNDKAFCVSSRDHRNTSLLDTDTMKTLAHYQDKHDELNGRSAPRFLCTSINKDITVLRHRQKSEGFALKSYRIGHASPIWEEHSSLPVILGALSPNGTTLVTVHSSGDPIIGWFWRLSAWGAVGSDGNHHHEATPLQRYRPPSKIAFTSETQFYTEERRVFEDDGDCEGRHVQTTSTPSTTSMHPLLHPRKPGAIPVTAISKKSEVRHTILRVQKSATQRSDDTTFSTTSLEDQPRTGVRHKEYRIRKTFSVETDAYGLKMKEVSEEEIPAIDPYVLDRNLEWVVDAKLRRVCWLPPGCVTGIENGYCFVGSSIVMAGQDGIVRKLTFRDPGSDS